MNLVGFFGVFLGGEEWVKNRVNGSGRGKLGVLWVGNGRWVCVVMYVSWIYCRNLISEGVCVCVCVILYFLKFVK